jgi:hypothetical protein
VFIVLVLSALVTIFAAAPPIPWIPVQAVKWFVVALSASVTFVAALLSKAGIDITAQLRETGRVELEAIKQKMMLRFTMKPMTDEERVTELESVVDAVREIEHKCGINPLVAVRITGRDRLPHRSAPKRR